MSPEPVLLLLAAGALAKVDFCSDHRLPPAQGPPVAFTKELGPWEFGVQSEFKSLHCCARGYSSIEWLKDGREYPWPGDSSSLILYPESANQTIYTPVLGPQDAGNYSCRVSKDSLFLVHNIQLHVFERNEYSERPLATYKPPHVSTARLGFSTRLFCEAFVGQTALPDATSEVKWEKKDNSSWRTSKVHVQRVQRDFGRIVGCYLEVDRVDWDDLGSYTCTITNSAKQRLSLETRLQLWEDVSDPLQLQVCTVVAVYIVVLLVTSAIIICSVRCVLKHSAHISRAWEKLYEISVGKVMCRKDVRVSVFAVKKERQFVQLTLVPALKQKGLEPEVHLVLDQEDLLKELKEKAVKQSKTVVVISSNSIQPWTESSLSKFLKTISRIDDNAHIISLSVVAMGEEAWDAVGALRRAVLPWDASREAGLLERLVQGLRHRPSGSLWRNLVPQTNSCSEVYV